MHKASMQSAKNHAETLDPLVCMIRERQPERLVVRVVRRTCLFAVEVRI